MKKEYYEWLHTWCDSTTANDLPRVLLVGDSITYGYQEKVRELLKGVCYVDYIATSYAIDSKIYNTIVESFFKDSKYDIVHFNHGLHGIHMSKRTYKSCIKKLLNRLKSKTILATSTIVYEPGNNKVDSKWSRRLEERNAAVKELAGEYGYSIDNLYAVSLAINKDFRSDDGTHYKQEGYRAFSESVAESVKVLLK